MKRSKPIPLFTRLIVELHSNCNRDCFFCPRYSDRSGHRKETDGSHVVKSMPSEMVDKILEDARSMGYRGLVTFHHLSEPFLDHRLINFAQKARSMGMLPYEHTNGDVLRRDEELCAKASDVFEHIVVGLYDHETREQRNNEQAFWRTRIGDKVRFNAVDTVYVRSHFTEKNLSGYEKRIGRRPPIPTFLNGKCTRPIIRLMVHYTGNVALCCEDLLEEFDLGSAFETPLEELWYSPRHVEIVRDLKAGKRNKYRLCSTCPMLPR